MMTKQQAIDYVRDHEDCDDLDPEDIRAAYVALYGNEPDSEDEAEGLWSHCCAAVETVDVE